MNNFEAVLSRTNRALLMLCLVAGFPFVPGALAAATPDEDTSNAAQNSQAVAKVNNFPDAEATEDASAAGATPVIAPPANVVPSKPRGFFSRLAKAYADDWKGG